MVYKRPISLLCGFVHCSGTQTPNTLEKNLKQPQAIIMSDTYRKSFSDRAEEKLQPDSSKSGVDKAKESVTNTADSASPIPLFFLGV